MPAPLAALAMVSLVLLPIETEESLRQVSVHLHTDRSTYYLGEPIPLALMVRNGSDQFVHGDFMLAIGQDEGDILYREVGGFFASLASQRPTPPEGNRPAAWICAERGWLTLKPGEQRRIDQVYGCKPATGGFLLDRPGQYELKAVCRPRPRTFPELTMETNVIGVDIVAPPAAEQEAFAEYRRDELVVLAQAPLAAANRDPAVIRKAADFIARHRRGVYAAHVRRGLRELLRFRRLRVVLSPDERRLYDELHSEAPDQD